MWQFQFDIYFFFITGGFARHTLEARSTVELMTGMGKGLMGAFAKPISGAAELVALTGQGVLSSVGFNALPQQRYPSVCHNTSISPSGFRIWKMLPTVLSCDQILFYHEITLVLDKVLRSGHVVLTSTIIALVEVQKDKLDLVMPIDKVELETDRNDKSLIFVHCKKESEEIEDVSGNI